MAASFTLPASSALAATALFSSWLWLVQRIHLKPGAGCVGSVPDGAVVSSCKTESVLPLFLLLCIHLPSREGSSELGEIPVVLCNCFQSICRQGKLTSAVPGRGLPCAHSLPSFVGGDALLGSQRG